MKNTLTTLSSVLLLMLVIGASCSGNKKNKPKETMTPSAEDIRTSSEKPIAYVRLDSLYSQYTYYKDVTEELAKVAEANRQQLTSKANVFSKAMEDFQRKIKINAFISADAQAAEERRLMSLQQQGQQLEAKLTQEFMLKQQQANEKLNVTIKQQIGEFNNGRYRFILSDLGVQSILFADSALDITSEVVEYLNEHYKKGELNEIKK